jgi:hypothetical protein
MVEISACFLAWNIYISYKFQWIYTPLQGVKFKGLAVFVFSQFISVVLIPP